MRRLASILTIVSIVALSWPFAAAPHAHAAFAIKGASIIPSHASEFSGDSFKQSMRNFQAAGGNFINLVIPYYQSNSGSTDINPGGNTPSDASLASAIQFAHSLGMKVALSVYLDTYSGEWRATINPGDRNTWYARYGDVLVKYGRLSAEQGADLYILGAELINMTSAFANGDNTARWNGMIDRVRGVYSGPLTYSANRTQSDQWQSEIDHIGFWSRMDYVGLSAYYELFGDGSVGSLESQWQNLNNSAISPLQRFGKPVIFTEIGYKSVSGAHNRPWDSGMGGPYDPQEQVNAYTAMLDFWNRQGYMQGLFLWWWSPNPGYGGSGNIDYTPQNKPAEGTLRQFWTASSPPPVTPGPAAVFGASGTANPQSVSPGSAVSLTANVRNTGGAASGIIVDLEVYNGSTRVFQTFIDGQNFGSGETKSYTRSFTPSSTGSYTFKIGVFNGNWSQNFTWNDSAATFQAGGGGTTQPPPPPPGGGTATTNIWWPTNGARVSGVQPFKAMLEGRDVSQYAMFWQVDGGGLVPMETSLTDYPHKEALVDLTNWGWRGSGPYRITFVSKDGGGNVISQASIDIFKQ